MNLFLATLLLLSGQFHASAGPGEASLGEQEKIQELLNKAKFIGDDEYKRVREKMIEIEKLAGLRDKDGNLLSCNRLQQCKDLPFDFDILTPVQQKRALDNQKAFYEGVASNMASLSNDAAQQYAAATKEYKQYQQKALPFYNEAISLTLKDFSIAPVHLKGPIRSGPPKPKTKDDVEGHIGDMAEWKPVFTDGTFPPGRWGETRPDGRVLIGPEAFAYPGRLAAVLYHESGHFDDFLTPRLDLRNQPAGEVRIRERQREAIFDHFGLTEDDRIAYDQKLEAEKERAEKWKGMIEGGLDPYKKSTGHLWPQDKRGAFFDMSDLDAIRQRAKEIREQEHARRLRDVLIYITQRACSDPPEGILQVELDSLPSAPNDQFCSQTFLSDVCSNLVFHTICHGMGVNSALRVEWLKFDAYGLKPASAASVAEFAGDACRVPRFADGYFQKLDGHFPSPAIPGASEAGRELTECAKEFYEKLLETNQYLISRNYWTLNPAWVMEWASRLHEKYSRLPLRGADLADFARFACENAGHITNRDKEGFMSNRYPSLEIPGAQAAAAGLSGCPRELFNKLIELNDRILADNADLNIDWVNSFAKELAEKYSAPPVSAPPSQPDNRRPERPERDRPGCGPCGDCGSGCGMPRPHLP